MTIVDVLKDFRQNVVEARGRVGQLALDQCQEETLTRFDASWSATAVALDAWLVKPQDPSLLGEFLGSFFRTSKLGDELAAAATIKEGDHLDVDHIQAEFTWFWHEVAPFTVPEETVEDRLDSLYEEVMREHPIAAGFRLALQVWSEQN
jgi:hypothetical protein